MPAAAWFIRVKARATRSWPTCWGTCASTGVPAKSEYLRTAVNGWNEIRTKHLLVTGGPWTRHTDYNGNRECFARTEDFDPWAISVEGCCDTTWIQLCLHLFETIGESQYLDAAEATLYNSLHGHQHADGIQWCYYTAPNEVGPAYVVRHHLLRV